MSPILPSLARVLLCVVLATVAAACGDEGGDGVSITYDLDLWVTFPAGDRFGALQFEVTYLGDDGEFVARGDRVDCIALVEAIAAANYVGENVLKAGMISLAGIRIPSAIMRCGFRGPEGLSAADFDVEVTDASDTESEPLDPAPEVEITAIVPR